MIDPTTRQRVGASDIPEVILEQIETFSDKWIKGSADTNTMALEVHEQYWVRIENVLKERDRRVAHMKRGDELPSGVLEKVIVY